MPWHVITKEEGDIEGTSSALGSEMAAIDFALVLMAAGVEVDRIKGPNTELAGDEIASRFAELHSERW